MDNRERIKFLVEAFELGKHPEGGYFKEVYRSKESIPESALPFGYKGTRNFGTSIYFLLTSDNFSSFHRIKQDETWHFYEGSTVDLHVISPSGSYQNVKIGSQIAKREVFQFTVPGGHWFSARVLEEDGYALVGCTVAPGFDFDDFELGARESLISQFPAHSEIITQLTYS